MKVVRVILRCGQERITALQVPNLQSWWAHHKGVGEIVGEYWACHFDEIAFAEVVEANVQGVEEPAENPALNRAALGISGLAAAIGSGSWKPPSE